MNDKSKIEEAIYEHESGTKIILSSLSIEELKKTNPKKLPEVIKKLKKMTDYILLDCAAGLGEEALSTIRASDELIIITNPDISSVTDALKTIKMAESFKKEVKGFIITRYEGRKTEMSISNIKEMLEAPLLGIVPEDRSIKVSQMVKNAVIHSHPKSRAARSYKEIAKRIIGPENLKTRIENKEGFFSRILRKIGL